MRFKEFIIIIMIFVIIIIILLLQLLYCFTYILSIIYNIFESKIANTFIYLNYYCFYTYVQYMH